MYSGLFLQLTTGQGTPKGLGVGGGGGVAKHGYNIIDLLACYPLFKLYALNFKYSCIDNLLYTETLYYCTIVLIIIPVHVQK